LKKLLFAFGACLSVTAAPAMAAPIACGGSDIAAELKADSPKVYRQIEAQAARIKNGKGLLWRVEAPGVAPSYLFGTIHFTDSRVHEFSPAILAAMAEARTVAVESIEILDESLGNSSAEIGELTVLPDGKTLDDILPDDVAHMVKTALASRLMSYEGFKTMKPWMLMQLLSYPACELASQVTDNPIVDKDVAARARAAGKTLIGLETAREQFASLDAIPMTAQIEMLKASALLSGQIEDLHETFVQLYLAGEVSMIDILGRYLLGENFDQIAYNAFMETLLDARNLRMRDRALPHLREGGIFIAVGGLHLPGDKGLVELLRQEGFTVTRLQ